MHNNDTTSSVRLVKYSSKSVKEVFTRKSAHTFMPLTEALQKSSSPGKRIGDNLFTVSHARALHREVGLYRLERSTPPRKSDGAGCSETKRSKIHVTADVFNPHATRKLDVQVSVRLVALT